MSEITVRHDGLTMPLDTFIDAYRMVRVEPFSLPSLPRDVRLLTVDAEGLVVPERRVHEIDLRTVVAFRPIDGQPEFEPCALCGTSNEDFDLCGDCASDSEWGW